MLQQFDGILFLFTDRFPTWCMPQAVMGAYSENTLQHSHTLNNKRNSPKTMFPIHGSTLSVMERLPGRPTHHTCIYTMKCRVCSSFLTADLPEKLWAWRECSFKKKYRNCLCRQLWKAGGGGDKVMCWRAVWGLHTRDVCNKDAPLVCSLIKNECRFQEW